jgi:signal transduction histidine kinase
MPRSLRLGLRAQIVLALSVVFLISFALLGTAAVRLSQAAAEVAASRVRPPLADLLWFYVSMTGLSVLILTYIALTHLIVRPLDQLTRSSATLATGSAVVRVPERGALEVVRLAVTFNEMAAQLRVERKALEDRLAELEQATSDLKDAQEQLIHGEKLASVGRLAAGVAHEIGNPLAAILGLVELLRAGGLGPEETPEFLARIQRETERINDVIRDLLDFSRRDADGEVPGQSADLAEVIADAVKLVRPQKDSHNVEIIVDVDPAIGRVPGAPHRWTQVVLNLLLNALDALDGRGTLCIRARLGTGGEGLLTVSDTGPGIAPEMLDRLFEPFTTTKPPGKGTGLGLAVCHALVEGLGGRIRASNLPEGGACFEVQWKTLAQRASSPPQSRRTPS